MQNPISHLLNGIPHPFGSISRIPYKIPIVIASNTISMKNSSYTFLSYSAVIVVHKLANDIFNPSD